MAGARDYQPPDFEAVVRLDAQSSTTLEQPIFNPTDVVGCLGANPAVVAVAQDHLVGSAVGRVDDDRAWVSQARPHARAQEAAGTDQGDSDVHPQPQ